MYFVECLHNPYGFHQDSTRTPPIDFFNLTKSKVLLKSTPCGLHEEWSGVEYTGEGLKVDWRWTGGGLHEDLWGSVRYSIHWHI
jgi:hypothetical protein